MGWSERVLVFDCEERGLRSNFLGSRHVILWVLHT